MEENAEKTGVFQKIKNHFTTHGFVYVGTSMAVAAAMVAVETYRAKEVKRFLVLKGIDPMEFTNPEMYNELKNQ